MAADGTANQTLRSVVQYEAFQDFAMLEMLENKIGKEKTLARIGSMIEKLR